MHFSALYTLCCSLCLFTQLSAAATIHSATTHSNVVSNSAIHTDSSIISNSTHTTHHSSSSSRPPTLHIPPTHILTPPFYGPTPTPIPHIRPHSPDQQNTQSPIAIVFEVLGGLVGFVLVLGFIRCLYSYKKTPDRDRIAAFVNRHQLEREMEELERNNAFHQHSYQFNPPPPPYFPKPPSYEDMNALPRDVGWLRRSAIIWLPGWKQK